MKRDLMIPYIFLITAWFCNIYDLIVGTHFYTSIDVLIFSNLMGILSLIMIILHYKDKKNKK